MINFTRVETKKIDENDIFEDLKCYLFEKDVFDDESGEDMGAVEDFPEKVQRIIFAKIGAMLIDYSKSEDF